MCRCDAKSTLKQKHLCSVKNEKKKGGQPPLQVHHQETQHDGGFTGMRKFGHDPVQTIVAFALSELALNRIAINLILSGLLFDGFELCAPHTSVSMTINGPAPIVLAMFLNAAIDQQADTDDARHEVRGLQDRERDESRDDLEVSRMSRSRA